MNFKFACFYLALIFLLSVGPVAIILLLDEFLLNSQLLNWLAAVIPFFVYFLVFPLYLFLGIRYSLNSFWYVCVLILLGAVIDASRWTVFNVVTNEVRIIGVKDFVPKTLVYFHPSILAIGFALFCVGCVVHWIRKSLSKKSI